MFGYCSGVVAIISQPIVRKKGGPNVFVRPDLEISFGLNNVGAIAYTARKTIQAH